MGNLRPVLELPLCTGSKMLATKLTPIERCILLALMAEGKELQENADIVLRLGIGMKAGHRKKLGDFGLIETRRAPFRHRLTEKGWKFVEEDFPNDIPPQAVKIGALNALFVGVRRQLNASGTSLQTFFGPSEEQAGTSEQAKDAGLTSRALNDSVWTESEHAMALALQSIPAFRRRAEQLRSGQKTAIDQQTNQLRLAAETVFQYVKQAASVRDVDLLYERGDEVPFDPVMFDCFEDVDVGTNVKVKTQPVVKNISGAKAIVARGVVEPLE